MVINTLDLLVYDNGVVDTNLSDANIDQWDLFKRDLIYRLQYRFNHDLWGVILYVG